MQIQSAALYSNIINLNSFHLFHFLLYYISCGCTRRMHMSHYDGTGYSVDVTRLTETRICGCKNKDSAGGMSIILLSRPCCDDEPSSEEEKRKHNRSRKRSGTTETKKREKYIVIASCNNNTIDISRNSI